MSAVTIQQPAPRHENGRKVRSDALPEHVDYSDTGCDMAPACLRCPLERCRYDEWGGARKVRRAPRDAAVQRYREEGLGIDALAARFGMSRRSVFRILARGRAP
jgi:AraC-like DNA-binding protein